MSRGADERRSSPGDPSAGAAPGAPAAADAAGGRSAPASEDAARSETTARRARVARSTAVFSVATGASRILGLFREIVARRYFGVEGPINTFTVAFQIPNLVRALVADAALSAAFVPVFSELLEKRQAVRAWRVASTLFWLVLLGLGGLTALFVLLAPWLMRPFGYQGAEADLVVGLSRVLFPIVVLLGLSGVVVGILNTYEHFAVPALTPVFWNLAIIAALVVGVPRADSASAKLYVYAGGIVAGTVIQLLLPLPWLRGRDDRLRVVVDWRDPGVRRVFVLMLPVTLGLGLVNFNQVINTFFAARYIDPTLAPSAIEAAFRIYMLPQGMFSVAIATVLFPSLARLAARGDLDGLRRATAAGLRQIGFLLLPASAISAALAVPIVRLLYERGEFGPHETEIVAQALVAFSAGLTFNGTMLMLTRAFFSLQSPWVPTAVALGNLAFQVVLNAALFRLGVWAIPLATSVVNIAGTAALLVVFRRRVGRIEGRRTLDAYARLVVASGAVAAAAYGVWSALDSLAGRSLGGQVLSVGGAVLAATAVFLVLARILRIAELDVLRSLFRRSRPA
ncbi:MAG: murein biosynthesis integral membrane protein MurJ [Thermoleophilia bacterium]|nr:murein biosynthesis integral membrane protein MurJ [Thermoleophilia bacterium]